MNKTTETKSENKKVEFAGIALASREKQKQKTETKKHRKETRQDFLRKTVLSVCLLLCKLSARSGKESRTFDVRYFWKIFRVSETKRSFICMLEQFFVAEGFDVETNSNTVSVIWLPSSK